MKGQFPWIGRSRGSAGGMTTSKINDKNVMRAKAFEVTNPKTAAQVMQRDFFKQVQEVCASVTEDQLRSLFGVKPKTMTRRNALSKQIAAAYTITDGVKSVDFSKLLTIGNGEKVDVNIYHTSYSEGGDIFRYEYDKLNVPNQDETNLIFVIFNATRKQIFIINTDVTADDDVTMDSIQIPFGTTDDCYVYPTCAVSGGDVSSKGFGSFIIKTRPEKTGRNNSNN